MSELADRCPRCQRPCVVERRPGREVTHGTVTAASDTEPVLVCPDHGDCGRLVRYDDAVDALDRIGLARRRWVGGDRCSACGEVLTMPVRRTVRPLSVTGGAGAVVTVTCDLPATRCPSCGLDQVPTRSQRDLDAALRDLFD